MKDSIEKLGLTFDREKYEKFMVYKDLLKEWNKNINLTAIIDEEEIITKHFIDSIKAMEFQPLKNAKSIIDVGTGAGFPGIPLKIVSSDIELTLLDSLNKRINFLKEVGKVLELKNVEYIHSRAEDGGNDVNLRENFDIAVSQPWPISLYLVNCVSLMLKWEDTSLH